MFDFDFLIRALAIAVVTAPALLVAVVGVCSLVDRPLGERGTSRLTAAAIGVALTASLGVAGAMLLKGQSHFTIALGNWIVVPHYHFSVKLLFDGLSLPFVILSLLLCGTISVFARQYLHREPGFHRFFALFALFVLGMVAASLAGTIETLFAGWELVGLSSALLVAFFQERPAPVRNGLRVWSVYRISDAALLIAAVVLHHMRGEGDFDALFGAGAWPQSDAGLSSQQAFVIGLLLMMAAAGKSALVPFSGWLPRAMEGPTPSSAIFYGAISVHLGVYLLLRASPMLALSSALCAVIVVWGLLTAALAALAARVQSDIKSALSYASLTQVGLMVAEIGLGLRWLALLHLIGHACLRTLQFVRAPTLLHDYHLLENALGDHLSRPVHAGFVLPSWRKWIYRWALERGYLDAFLDDYIVRPFLATFRFCDSLERRWTDFLSRRPSRESDQVKPRSDLVEELV